MIPATSSPHVTNPQRTPPEKSEFSGRLQSAIPFVLSLAVTAGVLGWLLFAPAAPEPAPPARRTTLKDSVHVAGPRLIAIAPGSPIEKKLESVIAAKSSLTEPIFTVTGRVVASLRQGDSRKNDYWQFDAPEVLTAFTDWQKAQADIVFAKTQLESVKELASTRNESQKKVVERLQKLVLAGTDSPKDLAAETTNQLQFQIQGRKEIHEAESTLKIAERNEAALARQLQQAGLDPDLLRASTSDHDIVMAEVPEGRLTQVQVGLGCDAKFFGVPGQTFAGKVNRVLPVLSKDRHSLRVLFVINDPKDQIRPGMFAEIGLGTDARETILIPSDAVLHVGRADYVLVHEQEGTWRVTEVKVGEAHGDRVELLDASLVGRRILTKNAILLKPPLVLSLAPSTSAGNGSGK